MTATIAIADDHVVQLAYTLTNDDGEVLDQSTVEEAFEYLHGAMNIVPGLERQLTGKVAGDKATIHVEAEEAYGDLGPEGERHTVEVPRGQFPPDAPLEEGVAFTAFDEHDRPFPIWIVSADAKTVVITPQHPLAGVRLHFDVEVLAVRAATPSELEHGHVHGAGCNHDH